MNAAAEWQVIGIDKNITHQIKARYIRTTDNAYVFYDVSPEQPVAIYPIRHFYVKRYS